LSRPHPISRIPVICHFHLPCIRLRYEWKHNQSKLFVMAGERLARATMAGINAILPQVSPVAVPFLFSPNL